MSKFVAAIMEKMDSLTICVFRNVQHTSACGRSIVHHITQRAQLDLSRVVQNGAKLLDAVLFEGLIDGVPAFFDKISSFQLDDGEQYLNLSGPDAAQQFVGAAVSQVPQGMPGILLHTALV